MREAHLHLASLGESLSLLNLERAATLSECLQRIALECEALRSPKSGGGCGAGGCSPDGCATPQNKDTCGHQLQWLRATGVRTNAWPEARWPTIAELDAVTGEIPTVLMSFDHHTAVANAAALRAARLSAGQTIPPNGIVVADADGRATGLLHEQAAYAAWRSVPERTMGERKRDILRALKLLRSMGFRQIHDMHAESWLGPMLGELDRAGTLSVEVHLYSPIDRVRQDAESKRLWESAMVRLAGGKVFADGTLSSRTAQMLHAYRDHDPEIGPHGKAMVTPAQLREHMRTMNEIGLDLAIHVIGDGAVRAALDAWEETRNPRSASRLRLEHCELIDEADVPRFHRFGVTASVQPCHLLTDIEVLRRHVPHRLDRVLPLRDLLNAGLVPGETLLFGSDAPIVRPNPEDSVLAATLRRRRGMVEADSIAPAQAIDEETAWKCFGLSAPKAAHNALPVIIDGVP